MTEEKKSAYLRWYSRRFGRPFRIGAKYMYKVLECYEASRCAGEPIDFKKYVDETAAYYKKARYSILSSIDRYIKGGWEMGCDVAWEKFTGWDRETTPTVKQAIPLICESFAAFYQQQVEGNEA